METKPTRRAFLKVGLSGMAILALPIGCGELISGSEGDGKGIDKKASDSEGNGRFFDRHQYETIHALVGTVIPEDQDPGAMKAGVADYIDLLLGAFTVNPPRIYAAGPFSGRHGGEDGFKTFLPLSWVKEIAWRTYIEGSQGIAAREFNGPVVGMQEIYTRGVEQLDSLSQAKFGANFKDMDSASQNKIASQADQTFMDAVWNHSVEGMYALPEYGGNKDLMGWKYIGYEGDRQPVGYSRRHMEEADPDRTLSRQELEEAAEFMRMVFAPYQDQLL